ncbi:prepilin-type N-terminal cleavage/methylation domain-containing protein [Pseudoalteromonas sp. MMG024]|uniref:prepilin-type N-terminal cleavage/methylation domain-containing protein n=1 Tax=Pseudoalteromonas sp. MMG024 TaxID=2909980 RepID=UPI001F420282|nr:prepilin-type N-terminal cleavage/methylation domain-containing protein [Pseudoalteromonas sp. MMG024]MCF6457527.1 prepilin-type N-terminal cleavage/methylation domain-containing protein [Pseudoalteromonas sp. MMG024]
MRRNSKGFTLIETLVTVTVLTLLLGLAYQSMSVFIAATNKSSSRFFEVEQVVELKLKLRASVRSMLDYYVKPDPTKPKELYLYNRDNVLRFVSLSSFFFDDKTEVAIQMAAKNVDSQVFIEVTECPIAEFLPLSLEQNFLVTENCRQQSYKLPFTSVVFNVALATSSREKQEFDLTRGFAETFKAGSELDHLLPEAIKLQFEGEQKTEWSFLTVIENRMKYLEGYGSTINI